MSINVCLFLILLQLELERVEMTGTIIVDGETVGKDEIGGSNNRLTTASPLYVGGVPSDYEPKGVHVSCH